MVKKIVLMVTLLILVGGLVFGGLMIFAERLDYAGARAYAADILAMEDGIYEFLEGEVGEWDDGAVAAVAGFDERVGKLVEFYESMGASSALKDEVVLEKYDGLSGGVEGFLKMRAGAGWLVGLISAMNNGGYAEVRAQSEAPDEFLAGMAVEMEEYLQKVEVFRTKYAGGKADNYNNMTEEYGVVLTEGEELRQKYGQVDLVEVAGVSEGSVRDWFARMRELLAVLGEKAK